MRSKQHQWIYHLMLLPGILTLIIFDVLPLPMGIVISLQKFIPTKGIFGSKFIGFDNFQYMFQLPDSKQIFTNTIVIAIWKIILNLIIPVIFAILLNEIRNRLFKKSIQTIVYLPHFLSWVILASIFTSSIFSIDGLVNKLITSLGGEPIFFMASPQWFQPVVILTDVWKSFGFNAIVFLAAITAISPALYEAAVIDGASRLQQMRYITLPSLLPTIILMGTLALGNVLNAGFDQIFNMYNPLVYETGDIIDTYVYRVGFLNAQFSLATAVGLTKSIVSFTLIMVSHKLAKKYAGYRLF